MSKRKKQRATLSNLTTGEQHQVYIDSANVMSNLRLEPIQTPRFAGGGAGNTGGGTWAGGGGGAGSPVYTGTLQPGPNTNWPDEDLLEVPCSLCGEMTFEETGVFCENCREILLYLKDVVFAEKIKEGLRDLKS